MKIKFSYNGILKKYLLLILRLIKNIIFLLNTICIFLIVIIIIISIKFHKPFLYKNIYIFNGISKSHKILKLAIMKIPTRVTLMDIKLSCNVRFCA